ncbi:MAG TPA: ribonuclease P protein component [Tepidisphaeraceae bacterium]|nr:ribonuclease P protein component [Tepidisphaeraceae bacterium]
MSARRYTLPKSRVVRGRGVFSGIMDVKVRETRGPLTAYAVPNDRGRLHLGIIIGRKVGTAPRRNRIKRLLRESFRMHQHDLPASVGYDVVIAVRPHEPLILAEYQKIMTAFLLKLHAAWQRRGASAPPPPPAPPAG